jgi:L-lactate utilization protein LutB
MMSEIDEIQSGLRKRNMTGYHVKDRTEAYATAMQMIPPQSTVGFGGSVTLEEIGILDALRTRKDITLLDRTKVQKPADQMALYRKMFSCDIFLSSTNAITLKGQLVNVDGRGNRVAMITYGPKKVIIIAGHNKITSNLDAAMVRLRTVACPLNLRRVNKLSQKSSLFSSQKWTEETIWGQISIIERQLDPERIHVILVDEDLGF